MLLGLVGTSPGAGSDDPSSESDEEEGDSAPCWVRSPWDGWVAGTEADRSAVAKLTIPMGSSGTVRFTWVVPRSAPDVCEVKWARAAVCCASATWVCSRTIGSPWLVEDWGSSCWTWSSCWITALAATIAGRAAPIAARKQYAHRYTGTHSLG